MAFIHIARKHDLSRNEARAKVEEIAKDLQGKLGASYRWDGDSLCFQRLGASGSIDVREGVVEVNLKLAMLLEPMKGIIESSIEKGFDVALSEPDDNRLA